MNPIAVAALADEIRFQDPDFEAGRVHPGWLVSRWNDAPRRTEAEVRDVIRGAIRRLERLAEEEDARAVPAPAPRLAVGGSPDWAEPLESRIGV